MIFFCTVQHIDLDIDELILWFEKRSRLTNRTHRIRFLQWNIFFSSISNNIDAHLIFEKRSFYRFKHKTNTSNIESLILHLKHISSSNGTMNASQMLLEYLEFLDNFFFQMFNDRKTKTNKCMEIIGKIVSFLVFS